MQLPRLQVSPASAALQILLLLVSSFLSSAWRDDAPPGSSKRLGLDCCDETEKAANYDRQGHEDHKAGLFSLLQNTEIAQDAHPKMSSVDSPHTRVAMKLESLDLSCNNLNGTVSPALWSPATVNLSLAGNLLAGSIPEEIGRMRSVQIVDFSNNSFSGVLPDELGMLEELRILDVSYNQFSGRIPADLGNAPNLRVLNFDLNNFDGRIPPEVAALDRLEQIFIGDNFLTGPIPMEFMRSQTLTDLVIDNNKLTGSLPDLPYPHTMRRLDVASNYLRGALPAQGLVSMKGLRLLNISDNDISGTIPLELVTLQSLEQLHMSTNWLSGPIPENLDLLSSLTVVSLQDNMLRGTIPHSLCTLSHLFALLLNTNYLLGSVPSCLGQRPLTFLTLHDNDLSGAVPNLQLNKCESVQCMGKNETPMKAVVTLYGNHFSCDLPQISVAGEGNYTPATAKDLQAYVAIGNEFTWGDRDWLDNAERDPMHFARKGQFRRMLATVSFGLTVLVCATFSIVGHGVFAFMKNEVWDTWWDDRQLLANREISGFKSLFNSTAVFSIIGVLGLLPVYFMYSNYVQCGDTVDTITLASFQGYSSREEACSTMSLVTFSGGAWAEAFVSLSWVVHLVAASYLLITGKRSRYGRSVAGRIEDRAVRIALTLVFWVIWLLILIPFAIPSSLYSMTVSLPSQNWLKDYFQEWEVWLGLCDKDSTNEAIWTIFHYGTPFVGAILVALVLPAVATNYCYWTGMEDHILLPFGYALAAWLAPVITTFYFDEECNKGWKRWWSLCGTNSLDVSISTALDAHSNSHHSITVLRTADICDSVGFRATGSCSRRLIKVITNLQLRQLGLDAVIFPAMFLIIWRLSTLQDGQLKWLGARFSYTTSEYFVQFNIWIGTAILWGPLIPPLLPLLLLVTVVVYTMQRLETRFFGRSTFEAESEECAHGITKTFGFTSAVCFVLFVLFHMWETGQMCGVLQPAIDRVADAIQGSRVRQEDH